MCRGRVQRRHERGAILVQTAVSILMLMGFAAFVCDYGVLLVSRGQAQNAADAGALAGANAILWDIGPGPDPTKLNATARPIAIAAARENLVWNQPGGVDVQFPLCFQAGEAGYACVEVKVHRDGQFGSATLPVFFGPVLGITSQGVGAYAQAQVVAANSTACLGSFAIPDGFINVVPGDDTFDPGDTYLPPTSMMAGSGYVATVHTGSELILKQVPETGNQVGPGWFRLLNLVPAATDPKAPLRSCGTNVHGLEDDLTGLLHSGVGAGVITDAVNDLIALDPGATWDAGAKRIQNSCVQSGSCSRYDATGANLIADPKAAVSPRVITLPILDPQQLAVNGVLRVVNFVGFFVLETMTGPSGEEIRGILLTRPGQLRVGTPDIYHHAAFLKSVRLIR